MKTQTLYRVENAQTMQGLWYRGDGVFNPHIETLTHGQCRNLPMEFDPAFKDGGDWFSACDNLPDMRKWFSLSDLKELHAQGYRLYSIEVDQYRTINGHAAFLRSGIIYASPASLTLISDEWSDQ